MKKHSISETKDNTMPEEISISGNSYVVSDEIVDATLKMNQLARIFRRNRMNDRAISFDKVEVKFNLNQEGEPEGVYFKVSKDANHMIEEFMLLANKKVAEFIKKKTFIYRIHDEPNADKLVALQTVIAKFGYKIDLRSKMIFRSH
jgi:ribonuclease R